MANEGKETISYLDILQTPVISGKALGMIWTGFPDVKYLNNSAVIPDETLRKELIERITELEEYTRNIRNGKKGTKYKEDARVDAERLFVDLCESGYVIKDTLTIAWIRTYQELRNQNSKEYWRISKDTREKLDRIEHEVTVRGGSAYIYDEKTHQYEIDILTTLDFEKKYFHKKNHANFGKLSKYMGELYIDRQKYSSDELSRVLIERLNLHLDIEEIQSIFPSEEEFDLGKNVLITTRYNALMAQGYGISEIEELSGEEIVDIINKGKNNDTIKKEHDKLKTNTILEYLDYINLDQYLINYIAKELISFENIGSYTFKKDKEEENSIFDMIDTKDFFERMLYVKKLFECVKRVGIINSDTKRSFNLGQKVIEFDESKMNEMMNQYSGDLYFSPKFYEAMRPFLYNRDENIWNDVDDYSYLRDLQISDADKKFLLAIDARNAFDLYKAGIVDKKFIIETLKEMKSPDFIKKYNETIESMNISFDDEESLKSYQVLYPSEVMTYLYDENILLNDDIKVLYEEDVLDLEKLNSTGISEETIKDFVSDEDLIEAYKNYIKTLLTYRNDETSENKDALSKALFLKNKRMTLYRKYRLEKMSKEEQTENAEKLILDYYADMDLESKDDDVLEALREMYKDRIVNFEAIRNSDPKFLQDLLINIMLKRGELTLDDTVKLKKSFSFEEQKLIVEEALKDENISENEKFILVMNMFFENTKDDTSARYEFLKRFRSTQYVGELDPMFATTEGELDENKNPDSSNRGKQDWEEHVYPDNIKWMLFMNIDKDAMATRYDNGYVEFYLPKFDVRVIEKYYTIRENKIQGPAYGVATCIMSDETYRTENESFVKTNDRGGVEINERNLRKIVPQRDRVAHITKSVSKNWMRSLVQKLGIDLENDTRYTKQELESLNKVIENYENCYERY